MRPKVRPHCVAKSTRLRRVSVASLTKQFNKVVPAGAVTPREDPSILHSGRPPSATPLSGGRRGTGSTRRSADAIPPLQSESGACRHRGNDALLERSARRRVRGTFPPVENIRPRRLPLAPGAIRSGGEASAGRLDRRPGVADAVEHARGPHEGASPPQLPPGRGLDRPPS